MRSVFDFEFLRDFGHNSPTLKGKGVANERRTDYLLSDHGFHPETRIQQMCPALSRPTSCSKIFMLRPIPLHGLCPADVPRKSSRYRNLLASHATQTLSRWVSWQSVSEHLGRCQRKKRLANLCRFRSRPDSYCQSVVCRRRLRFGTATDHLRSRFDDDRSLSFSLPM